MQIFVVNGKGKVFSLSLNSWRVCKMLMLTVALLVWLTQATHGWISVDLAPGYQRAYYQMLLQNMHTEMSGQRLALANLRAESQDKVDALSARVSSLQSRLLRLDAIGARVAELAKFNKAEFAMREAPGIGGPLSFDEKSLSADHLTHLLNQMEVNLDKREARINILESLVVNSNNSDKLLPQGSPVSDGWVSSLFGWRADPFTGKKAFHQGLDLSGAKGTLISAVAAGIVVSSGSKEGYGNLVEISHGNGYTTIYAHNKKNLVTIGQRVEKGQKIATMGSTGRSTGEHVHFEVRHEDRSINPLPYLKSTGR